MLLVDAYVAPVKIHSICLVNIYNKFVQGYSKVFKNSAEKGGIRAGANALIFNKVGAKLQKKLFFLYNFTYFFQELGWQDFATTLSSVAYFKFRSNVTVKFEEDVCEVGDNVISIIVILFFLLSRSFFTCRKQLCNIRNFFRSICAQYF